MREISTLSGARLAVSNRDEVVAGTAPGNRLVTITGTPSQAQTAHALITRRMENPSAPPTRRGGVGADDHSAGDRRADNRIARNGAAATGRDHA